MVAFQQEKGLLADGVIGTDTWRALLDYTPIRVAWGSDATAVFALRKTLPRSLAARPGGADAPRSASLPGRNEIDPGPGP